MVFGLVQDSFVFWGDLWICRLVGLFGVWFEVVGLIIFLAAWVWILVF